jgi:arylsulfatase A-like enzyme
MDANGGGVSVLDSALGGLLDSLQDGELGKNTLFLFGSTRGFSLGEHRRIGIDEFLYSENLHLPLMIRFPDGFGAAVRNPMLFQSGDLRNFLADPPSLQTLIGNEAETFRESLIVHGENGENALITPEWFLRRIPVDDEAAPFELYVKPDDRWEVNDVADRCGEILEELNKFETLDANARIG